MSMELLAIEYFKDHQEVEVEFASDLQYMAHQGMSYFYDKNPSSLSLSGLRGLRYCYWDAPNWLRHLVDEEGVDRTYQLLLESALFYGHCVHHDQEFVD